MRRLIHILCISLTLVACADYDEISQWNKSHEMDGRIEELERLCDRLNSDIRALHIIVETLQQQDFVTGVTPIIQDGKEIGYTITFSKSGSVTIYHGKQGAAGHTPVIGVELHTDGVYYWTLDGEWLTDSSGGKIRAQGDDGKSAYELAVERGYAGTMDEWLASLDGADGKSAYELAVENGYEGTREEWLASLCGETGDDGITPQLQITDGYWEISYDGGATWERLGRATGDKGDKGEDGEDGTPLFEDVDNTNADYVIFRLAGGEEIRVPRYRELAITFTESSAECIAGETAVVKYTLTASDPANVEIECLASDGYRAEVDKAEAQIRITAPSSADYPSSKLLLFATDGRHTVMASLALKTVTINYIRYTANSGIAYDDFFWGADFDIRPERCSYDSRTGEGAWAYTGTVTQLGNDIDNDDCPWFINTFNGRSELTGIELPETITHIDQFAFSKTGIIDITIPSGVTSFGSSAFEKCTSLQSADLSQAQIETLGVSTFADCTGLHDVKLPASLKKIEYNAFIRCAALEEIVIPDQVTDIGRTSTGAVFSQCANLRSVTLGEQVSLIGKNSFNECHALETIICKGAVPPTLGSGVFPVEDPWGEKPSPKYKIYVPQSSLADYRSRWSTYSKYIVAQP